MLCLVAQLCPTFCDPMDCSPARHLCSPPGTSIHGDSPGRNTGVGCHALLQGIFPTLGSNPSLLHCTQILYQLSHWGALVRYGRAENSIVLYDYDFSLKVGLNSWDLTFTSVSYPSPPLNKMGRLEGIG